MDTSIVHKGKYAGRSVLIPDTNAKTRAEVKVARAPNLGTDDYYTTAYYFPVGWTPGTVATSGFGACVSINQLNWQGMPGSAVSFQAHSDHIVVALQSGWWNSAATPQYQWMSNADNPTNPYINVADMYAVPPGQLTLGVWHEFIIHAHWATDNSGVLEVWHRIKGQNSWTKTVNMPAGIAATLNYRKSDGWMPTSTQDKIGPYRWSHSNLTETFYYDTFSRSTTFSAAAAVIQ